MFILSPERLLCVLCSHFKVKLFTFRINTHSFTITHRHIYAYIKIFIYMYVCIYCLSRSTPFQSPRHFPVSANAISIKGKTFFRTIFAVRKHTHTRTTLADFWKKGARISSLKSPPSKFAHAHA